ncbi:PREDICTED: zinc finger protein 862-like [Priapulus caudatus]|uniref:Zinc finger protein 862-like n=1 Tax=Priapulus caudatus TaxID=37621 RepID=A0ABM1DQ74_PRICU|nr:PREDICTED: zinc finger protein 862-like [Priapulus caudatus]
MWRYIAGASNPNEKGGQTQEKKREYQQEYETNKRVRHYCITWEKSRPWLKDTENGMICTACKDHGDTTTLFAVGCQSYKLDSLVKHERSKQHEKAVLFANAKTQPRTESQAAKIIQTLNADIFEKLEKMFRTCHALVRNNRPLSDFNWLCDLDEMKGLRLGETYHNTPAAKEFIKAIAEVHFQEVNHIINKSRFICVIGDGSTDSAIKEQEMWYVRTSTAGQVDVKFIGVKSADKADAVNIVNGLQDLVITNVDMEWPAFMQKMVAVACDGASVMVGCKAGVGALLRKDQPSLVTLHCMAHRLELSLKDASKSLKLYDKAINTVAMGLYYFYHNSSLNRAMLRRSYEALKQNNDSAFLIPTRIGGTRWIGHTMRALTNLISSYKYIMAHLGQLTETTERVSADSKSKAHAFMKLLKSKDVVCFLLFLMDALAPLHRLSLQLQERTCVIAKQHSAIASTLEAIRKYKTSDGPHLRKVSGKETFEEIQLTNCSAYEFGAARCNLIKKIEEALEKRFSEFLSQSVVSATKIADIQMWPHDWESLKDHGDEDLRIILEHFKTVLGTASVDLVESELEWIILKKEIHDTDFQSGKVPDWFSVNIRYKGQLTNILAVMDLILTMSPSSAEAERGFSQLKLVKTNIRSKLGQTSLNHCLAIKMLSPDIKDFNPTKAIHHWNESCVRSRRPTSNANTKQSSYTQSLQVLENIQETLEPLEVVEGFDSLQDSDSEIDSESSASDLDDITFFWGPRP